MLVELLWAQRQRVRGEADTSRMTHCPSLSGSLRTLPFRPPPGLLPSCGFAPAIPTPGTGPPELSQDKSQLSIKPLLHGALGMPHPCWLNVGSTGQRMQGAWPSLTPLLPHPLGSSCSPQPPGSGPILRRAPGWTYPGKCPGCQPVLHRETALSCPLCPEWVLLPVRGWGPPLASGRRVHSTSWAPAHSHWGGRGQR